MTTRNLFENVTNASKCSTVSPREGATYWIPVLSALRIEPNHQNTSKAQVRLFQML